MKNNNSNIFVGDRSYKTNFFLKFKSSRMERKFREEAFIRTRYSLRGFLVFSLLFLAVHFMSTDCYTYDYSCRHQSLILLTMTFIIAALGGLHFKIKHLVVQIFMSLVSVYFNILFLEGYSYHTSLIMMTLYTSVASFLIHQVWFLQLLHNLISYALLVLYLDFSSAENLFKQSPGTFLLDLALYNLAATTFLAFLEKKERWVLVETYKKSDKIFKQLYEELPYAFYVIDKSKRILYSSAHGLNLLSAYARNCISCNFSRVNVNLQDMIEKDYITTVDETLAKATPYNPREEPVACFVTLKPPAEDYDHEKTRFTLEKDNLYKVKVLQTIWKTNYAYLVVMKDYTSKKKSEKIASKTIDYLLGHVENAIKQYDQQGVEKQQLKFKSKILSSLLKIKFLVFNIMLIFYRIFTKNEGLKTKKNFNIRTSILSAIGILSFKAKDKNCDLHLKFEQSSFPNEVYGDEHLFQQTFTNTLNMLLGKLSNTNLAIDCKFETLTPEGQYVLSFEFKFAKSDSITYEDLSSKIEPSHPVLLDHILNGDDLLFFLALIRPAVEVFNGKMYTYESDNDIVLGLELLLQASVNSREKSYPEYQTLKSVNYNASSNPKPYLYFWKCQNEEAPEESHEAEVESPSIERSIGVKPKILVNESLKNLAPPKNLEELNKSNNIENKQAKRYKELGLKSTTSDQTPSRGRMDEKKVQQELQKLIHKGSKNFGSQEDVLCGSGQSVPGIKTTEESQGAEPKKNLLELHEEEKEENEEKPKEAASSYIPINGFQTDLGYDRMTSAASSTSIPEMEGVGKTIPALRIHHYTLKLAITKALMELIDDQKRDEMKKNGRNLDIVPILEGITLEERVEGLEIKETELCDRALKHLSTKLNKEKYCEDFIVFANQYARQLEEDIYRLQANDEGDHSLSVYHTSPRDGGFNTEVGNTDSPRFVKAPAIPTQKTQSSFKIYLQKQSSRDSSFSKDSERSKERNLNERFLISPSINRTMTLRSAMSLTAKTVKEQLLPYLGAPVAQGSKSVPKLELSSKPELDPIEEVQKKLLPFKDPEHLPGHLMVRMATNRRKWSGAPNEIVSNAPEKMFLYNDVFTILAVDDSEFVFKGLEALPIKYKKKFDFAKNGTEALKKYLSNINQGILYHFILLDLQMPVMDGFETARVIRAEEVNKNYPHTYICAMSAFEDQETINRTRKEGMDNFCQKPLRSEVLNNLIKTRCEQIGIKLTE